MVVEVINTGSELLLGQVVNTHASFLGQQLVPLGLRISRAVTVPDGPAIREALSESLARADIVLVTGGLGPTSDDITRDVTAELLGLELKFDETIFSGISRYFSNRNIPMPEIVRVQAMVPTGAQVLANPYGTAPGLSIRTEAGKHLFLLPGPPRELMPMFLDHVAPLLRTIAGNVVPIAAKILRTIGVGESAVQERVEATIRATCPSVEVGYCARSGEVDVRLLSATSAEEVQQACKIVSASLGDAIYSLEDENLEQVVIRLAQEAGLTIATAESCTGGGLANRLTHVPGASAVFVGGVVTYANSEKIRQLDVPASLLETHGAVSEPVAAAMARGLKRRTGADLAIATTGIAGPGGGTPDKPVGLCFIGFQSKDEHRVIRLHFPTDRETFKYRVCQQALDMLRRHIRTRHP